ncbi:MAG: hypothetical protein K2L12_03285 [Clostridia bacterium]|nr:hypothetical protein [Clostridia bacterium]
MSKQVYTETEVNGEIVCGGKAKTQENEREPNAFHYSILKEEISPDNVFAMSEIIAVTEARYLIGYIGSRMQKMYTDLFMDIKNKNDITRILSDGYDLVQECALYLCEHYGKHLNDVIGYTKKGKTITVRMACIRKMLKLVNRKSRDYYRNISIEALTPKSEPSIEIKEEVKQNFIQCDKIVESLNLTENMRIALECRMAGLSYPEIGRVIARAQATVYEYFIKMRQRYTAIYG